MEEVARRVAAPVLSKRDASSVFPGDVIVDVDGSRRESDQDTVDFYLCLLASAQNFAKGELQEIFFGESNYVLVKIPPGIANGYKAYGDKPVILANCATEPHAPDEIKRIPPNCESIPYDWSIQHG